MRVEHSCFHYNALKNPILLIHGSGSDSIIKQWNLANTLRWIASGGRKCRGCTGAERGKSGSWRQQGCERNCGDARKSRRKVRLAGI